MLHKLLLALTASITCVTACNPLTESGCPADPALAGSFKEDFTSESKYFSVVNSKGVSYTDDGLALTIAERFDNPSLKSNFYIMFGKVEVVLQAAQGQGIISSFYLQSDDLDEVDIELFGTDTTQFQSNFFAKGYTGNYDRGQYITTSSDPTQNFHTYTLEWTKDSLIWSLDGSVVRTLLSTDPKGFPQSPMYIMMGDWAGGDSTNAPGTIEWAGGATDYSQAPFTMYIKSVIVADYSTGSEYSYGDTSGSWESIVAKGGSVNGRQSQADSDFASLQGGESVSEATVNSVSASESSTAAATASSSVSASSSASGSGTVSATSTFISSAASSLGGSSLVIASGSSNSVLTGNAASTIASVSKASASTILVSASATQVSTIATGSPITTVVSGSVVTSTPVTVQTVATEVAVSATAGEESATITATAFGGNGGIQPSTLATVVTGKSTESAASGTTTGLSASATGLIASVTSANSGASNGVSTSLAIVFAVCGYFFL
ncbi:probable glycosidase Crh1p [[Candida] railenensis]|uniref:Crh-like protein n=1 Tax=[Candida] railenensis TaxID=45579 RepID=A0A9P0QUA7_9ASCO|nr:probable glycosidase Crh1p [[Candida] railenensis]